MTFVQSFQNGKSQLSLVSIRTLEALEVFFVEFIYDVEVSVSLLSMRRKVLILF